MAGLRQPRQTVVANITACPVTGNLRLVRCCLGLEGWNPRTFGKDGAPLQCQRRWKPPETKKALTVVACGHYPGFFSGCIPSGLRPWGLICRFHQILRSRLLRSSLCASAARATLGSAYMRMPPAQCKEKTGRLIFFRRHEYQGNLQIFLQAGNRFSKNAATPSRASPSQQSASREAVISTSL